ncbi:MAG: hydantoinase/oxoprolinase family protein [Acidobacteria bacterium]|nr:hydantoinase/oxoprolinase family protein [Acidobacteriota bacterium]
MFKLAIDVGGTHTDALVFDGNQGLLEFKTDTTPQDLRIGVFKACEKIAEHYGVSLKELLERIESIIHATTVSTNAVIQRKGAPVGMITTAGFADVVELRRGRRDTGLNVRVEFPRPLVPRYLRLEVKERMSHEGKIVTALDEESVRKAMEKLDREKIQSLAVAFLHSHLNPVHEKKAAAIIAQEWPDVEISLSCDVLPQIGEFERFSTTVLDAYVAPLVRSYLISLDERLRSDGFKGRLLIAQSNGGVATPEAVAQRPIWTIGSGPCGGPVSALYYARSVLNTRNVIATDAGGTSFDVTLIANGEIGTTTDDWVADQRIAIPMTRIHSVGAGGGSIGWIDSLGVLRVGPQSAGASPGPACYAKGGEEPTLTDAALLLGYVNPDYFLSGERRLEVTRATKAIEQRIAKPLRKSAVEAAEAIFRVSVANMSSAIREKVTREGYDAREFCLVAGGGAGPLVAAPIAQELAIRDVLVPNVASCMAAFGWLRSDIQYDFSHSMMIITVADPAQVDLEKITRLYEEMESDAVRMLKLQKERFDIYRSVEMRYDGQFRESEIPMPRKRLTARDLASVIQSFHKRHVELYTFSMPDRPVELINYRIKIVMETSKPKLEKRPVKTQPAKNMVKGSRNCFFLGRFHKTTIYDGNKLKPGHKIAGPAIVELAATTLVLPPGFKSTVDKLNGFHVQRR